eukprot:gene6324-2554_t
MDEQFLSSTAKRAIEKYNTSRQPFAGVNDIIYVHIFHLVIPPQLRGKFFGWRQTIDNSCQLVGGASAAYFLSIAPFPSNYGWTFMLIFLCGVFSNILLSRVQVPTSTDHDHERKKKPSLWEYGGMMQSGSTGGQS